MKPIFFALPGNETLGEQFAKALPLESGDFDFRHFPDGETYVRLRTAVKDRAVLFLCTLYQPDDKVLPLLFLAETARELGAKSIGLVSPYLAYLRQDRRFHEGESISSKHFAKIISNYFNWLVTVDPHLHRYRSLSEIYSVPTRIVHAAEDISQWIAAHVENPLIVGPDSESEQWVKEVARMAGSPHVVLEKIRRGDREVEVSLPEISQFNHHTPVLVDDIISTARTMIETVKHMKRLKLPAPICVAVHGVFADGAYQDLCDAGAKEVVTSNTIPHKSNRIDLAKGLIEALASFIGKDA